MKVVTSDVKSEEQPEHEETDDIDMSVYTSRQTSQAVETVDVKSCLQLLLDLFSQWLDPSVSPRPPVMLVYEIVKSVRSLMSHRTMQYQLVLVAEMFP